MPNWNQVLNEIKAAGSTYDIIRRKYLKRLSQITGRNTIVYYSGWLQKGHLQRLGLVGFEINDSDKNGFMTTTHQLVKSKGLDLILHTPGGDVAATESLVDYLRELFETDIRAIVPQIAMSAGTLIACACKEILMGKHSSLGPIDPQIGGISAHAIMEEFNRAAKEIKKDPSRIPLWQPIISKYNPTLIGECEKAEKWSKEMATEWLSTGMFADDPDKTTKVKQITSELGSHKVTKTHSRHISLKRAQEISLKVKALEDDKRLQDAVLTVHHACIHTLAETAAYKIIENHKGTALIQQVTAQAQGR